MRNNLRLFLSLGFVLTFCFSAAQQNKTNGEQNQIIDSLNNLLQFSNYDTTRVNILNNLSSQYINTANYEKALQYAKDAKLQGEKLNYNKGIADAYNRIGLIYFQKGNYPEALNNHHKSLKISEKIGNRKGIANSNYNIGGVYMNQGDYKSALERYSISLKIREEIKDKKGISGSYCSIGNIYFYQGNYERALDNYLRSLKIGEEIGDKYGVASTLNSIGLIYFSLKNYEKSMDNYVRSLMIREEIGDKKGMASCYSNIGLIYYEKGDSEKALRNYLESLKIYEEIGNKQFIAYSLNNIGLTYIKQRNFEKALDNYFKSLEIKKEIGDEHGIAASYINIGNIYTTKGKLQEANQYFDQALTTYKKIGSKDGLKDVYSSLALLFDKKGDYKQAYNYHKLYSDIKDTILNEQSNKQIAEMSAKYDSEKKEKELIQKDAEITKQRAETEKQNLQRNVFIIGFVAVLVFAFFAYRGYQQINAWKQRAHITYRQIQEANKLLEEKNIEIETQKQMVENKNQIIENKQKGIIDSITYAKRIQISMLPSDNLVKASLPECFILYMPKDIVAGDFYWMEKMNDLILFAAADCTGHGVPGAMVSVACNASLNRAFLEIDSKDPGKLLDKTRELLVEQFEKHEEEVKDGMDISLCVFNTKTKQLKWAGANNPLWIVHNGELTEIKANKQPVGKYIDIKLFDTHTIQLEKNDCIYVFSDGYADQFGGEKNKKFKASAMKELLLSIQDKTMEEQKEKFHQAFMEWKGNLEQIDDVLVMGIKI